MIISISAQAYALHQLSIRAEEIRKTTEKLCSELGILSQEYMIINEAMRLTLEDLNGGPIDRPTQLSFPELNHRG